MPGLKACKAAERQGGAEAHWNMFDRVQRAHLVEARNIADEAVLAECAREVGLDLQQWGRDFASEGVERAVWADIAEARVRGIYAVPTVVIDDHWTLPGALPETAYKKAIIDASKGSCHPHLRSSPSPPSPCPDVTSARRGLP